MRFVDSKLAFDGAIEDGYLSTDPSADNYAGAFMYMGTEDRETKTGDWTYPHCDGFKHIITRSYLWVPCEYFDSAFSR